MVANLDIRWAGHFPGCLSKKPAICGLTVEGTGTARAGTSRIGEFAV
jgi:hypothetical protein